MFNVTNHTETGDAVLSSTGMHVAGLLARWPLQALGNAVRLLHHTGVYWILNHALHTAILHATIARGGTRAIGTDFVDVCESRHRVRCYNNLCC